MRTTEESLKGFHDMQEIIIHRLNNGEESDEIIIQFETDKGSSGIMIMPECGPDIFRMIFKIALHKLNVIRYIVYGEAMLLEHQTALKVLRGEFGSSEDVPPDDCVTLFFFLHKEKLKDLVCYAYKKEFIGNTPHYVPYKKDSQGTLQNACVIFDIKEW